MAAAGGFWSSLQKPIFALAPMANVTDAAFRKVIARRAKPHVIWTEFVSCEALTRATDPDNFKRVAVDLLYDPAVERPIVAQLFGGDVESMARSVAMVRDMGFDGIDLNFGCPDRGICRSGAGAELIKSPKLAQQLVLAAKKEAGCLPVSVKTRIGWNSPTEMDDWLAHLLDVEPAALTVHLRTRKELSMVPAHWSADVVGRAAELVHNARLRSGVSTLVLGNGDVNSVAEAREKSVKWGLDGVMMGRAIFGNPFLFLPLHVDGVGDVTIAERLDALREHLREYRTLLLPHKGFKYMRKHFKSYVSGFPGAKDARIKLMEAETHESAEDAIADIERELASRGLLECRSSVASAASPGT